MTLRIHSPSKQTWLWMCSFGIICGTAFYFPPVWCVLWSWTFILNQDDGTQVLRGSLGFCLSQFSLGNMEPVLEFKTLFSSPCNVSAPQDPHMIPHWLQGEGNCFGHHLSHITFCSPSQTFSYNQLGLHTAFRMHCAPIQSGSPSSSQPPP